MGDHADSVVDILCVDTVDDLKLVTEDDLCSGR